jgi:hypothetical protein
MKNYLLIRHILQRRRRRDRRSKLPRHANFRFFASRWPSDCLFAPESLVEWIIVTAKVIISIYVLIDQTVLQRRHNNFRVIGHFLVVTCWLRWCDGPLGSHARLGIDDNGFKQKTFVDAGRYAMSSLVEHRSNLRKLTHNSMPLLLGLLNLISVSLFLHPSSTSAVSGSRQTCRSFSEHSHASASAGTASGVRRKKGRKEIIKFFFLSPANTSFSFYHALNSSSIPSRLQLTEELCTVSLMAFQ